MTRRNFSNVVCRENAFSKALLARPLQMSISIKVDFSPDFGVVTNPVPLSSLLRGFDVNVRGDVFEKPMPLSLMPCVSTS